MTAMQQALANEALERMAENARELGLDYDAKSDHRLMEQTAQQEYEAVRAAWMAGYTEGEREAFEQPAQQQEPMAYRHKWDKSGERCVKCGDKDWMGEACTVPDTSPPASKPWVGLTEQERKEIYRQAVYVDGAIQMTEAKLREKNA